MRQHWADVSPYTSFYKLAKTCVFVKQLLSPIIETIFYKYGALSPEVTELICRVPFKLLSRLP